MSQVGCIPYCKSGCPHMTEKKLKHYKEVETLGDSEQNMLRVYRASFNNAPKFEVKMSDLPYLEKAEKETMFKRIRRWFISIIRGGFT